jgi:hypothetical protein
MDHRTLRHWPPFFVATAANVVGRSPAENSAGRSWISTETPRAAMAGAAIRTAPGTASPAAHSTVPNLVADRRNATTSLPRGLPVPLPGGCWLRLGGLPAADGLLQIPR